LPPVFPVFLVYSIIPAAVMALYPIVNLLTRKGLTWEIIDGEGVPPGEPAASRQQSVVFVQGE